MVCTGKNGSDSVLLVCSRDSLELKESDTLQSWNGNFEKVAPTGNQSGPVATRRDREKLYA